MGADISNPRVVELRAVIGHDRCGDAVAAYYGLPDEVCSVGLGDPGQRLGFDPLSEVVDSDDGVLVLPRGFGKLADNVYAPFCEGGVEQRCYLGEMAAVVECWRNVDTCRTFSPSRRRLFSSLARNSLLEAL